MTTFLLTQIKITCIIHYNLNKGAQMFNDPSLADLYTQTSEEYYEGFASFDDEEIDMDDECPDWIKEQLDEELPF